MPEEFMEHSPEFLFGKILSEIGALKQGAAELTAAVRNLPETNAVCQSRYSRLVTVETEQKKCQAEMKTDARFKQQAGLKLWHGIILVGASSTLQLVVMLLLLWAQK